MNYTQALKERLKRLMSVWSRTGISRSIRRTYYRGFINGFESGWDCSRDSHLTRLERRE